MLKDMIQTSLLLVTVAALSALILAVTEAKTAPIIKANLIKKEIELQNKVFPAADFFQKQDIKLPDPSASISAAYTNQKLSGAVLRVSTRGYSSDLVMLVGIDLNGKIKGAEIISSSETPGLGDNINSEQFSLQFCELLNTNPEPNFKIKKDDGDVDAVTAATVTSRAFCSGIQKASSLFVIAKSKLSQTPLASD